MIGNFLFGELLSDAPEHNITPILKLIDFGSLERLQNGDGDEATGEQGNVLDVGIMMATLMLLLTGSKYVSETISVDATKLGGNEDVETPAKNILPDDLDRHPVDPCPEIEKDMRLLVAACMADLPVHRPRLSALERFVTRATRRRRPEDYGNPELETDQRISQIIQLCIFDAQVTRG
ncbi:hypothetical protein RRF57_013281 [Xylaria bambusicola]|uniref:Protein kinase domain-containing protein n=1 Tax=Xylaria bambusicola TaxID=326684 RepID=A0AAN7ZE74_9PEZI